MSTATAEIKLTPELMAQAFWGMGSDEQVRFLALLGDHIKADHESGNKGAYGLGELQWHYVGHELLKPENKQARDMLMTMAAPLYLHTLLYTERYRWATR